MADYSSDEEVFFGAVTEKERRKIKEMEIDNQEETVILDSEWSSKEGDEQLPHAVIHGDEKDICTKEVTTQEVVSTTNSRFEQSPDVKDLVNLNTIEIKIDFVDEEKTLNTSCLQQENEKILDDFETSENPNAQANTTEILENLTVNTALPIETSYLTCLEASSNLTDFKSFNNSECSYLDKVIDNVCCGKEGEQRNNHPCDLEKMHNSLNDKFVGQICLDTVISVPNDQDNPESIECKNNLSHQDDSTDKNVIIGNVNINQCSTSTLSVQVLSAPVENENINVFKKEKVSLYNKNEFPEKLDASLELPVLLMECVDTSTSLTSQQHIVDPEVIVDMHDEAVCNTSIQEQATLQHSTKKSINSVQAEDMNNVMVITSPFTNMHTDDHNTPSSSTKTDEVIHFSLENEDYVSIEETDSYTIVKNCVRSVSIPNTDNNGGCNYNSFATSETKTDDSPEKNKDFFEQPLESDVLKMDLLNCSEKGDFGDIVLEENPQVLNVEAMKSSFANMHVKDHIIPSTSVETEVVHLSLENVDCGSIKQTSSFGIVKNDIGSVKLSNTENKAGNDFISFAIPKTKSYDTQENKYPIEQPSEINVLKIDPANSSCSENVNFVDGVFEGNSQVVSCSYDNEAERERESSVTVSSYFSCNETNSLHGGFLSGSILDQAECCVADCKKEETIITLPSKNVLHETTDQEILPIAENKDDEFIINGTNVQMSPLNLDSVPRRASTNKKRFAMRITDEQNSNDNFNKDVKKQLFVNEDLNHSSILSDSFLISNDLENAVCTKTIEKGNIAALAFDTEKEQHAVDSLHHEMKRVSIKAKSADVIGFSSPVAKEKAKPIPVRNKYAKLKSPQPSRTKTERPWVSKSTEPSRTISRLPIPGSLSSKIPKVFSNITQSCSKIGQNNPSNAPTKPIVKELFKRNIQMKENSPRGLKSKQPVFLAPKTLVASSKLPMKLKTPNKYSSVQSPVGKYIQDPSLSPLIQTVKPQNKIASLINSKTKTIKPSLETPTNVKRFQSIIPAKYCLKDAGKTVSDARTLKPVLKAQNSSYPVLTKHIGPKHVIVGSHYLEHEESALETSRLSQCASEMDATVVQELSLVQSLTIQHLK